jgi:hypothetical protein
MGPTGQLGVTERYSKGRLYKNAAEAFYRAALRQRRAGAKSYFIERAYKLYTLNLREKLHETRARRRAFQRRARQLLGAIGFAKLTVSTGSQYARLCLFGFRYQYCHNGQTLSIRLRPGQYRLELRQPGQAIGRRVFQLLPRRDKHIAFFASAPNLLIKSMPSRSSVYIRGMFRGRTPLRIRLPEGEHTIVIKKKCFVAARQRVQIVEGRVDSILVQLTVNPANTRMAVVLPRQRNFGVSMLVVGGILLGAGIGTQIAAGHYFGKKDEFEDSKNRLLPGSNFARMDERIGSAEQQALTWQVTAGVTGGLGLIALVIGVARLNTLPKPNQNECSQVVQK